MAKYSTGRSSGGDGDACELCGEIADSLTRATVAGADLLVCPSCRPHDDTSSGADDERSSGREIARNAARAKDVWAGDSSRWEREGTDYDDDPLPYLVSGYGERVEEARQDAGYQLAELAAALDVSESDLLAVEQGRAARGGVGGSVIEAIQDHLDVELAEE
jgi:ribosome-binding protein aMBF1 (putative translation factor)